MNWLGWSNHLMKWLYMILKLSGIWWLFNVPYVFLSVNLLAAREIDAVHTIVLIGIILFPFVAAPATASVMGITRRFLKGDDGFPLFKMFLHYYKREYKKSMGFGCLNASILVVFYLALRYYAGISSILAIVFYVLVIVTPFFFLYVYCFLVDQELPLKAYLTNTMFLLLMHPLNAILMILDAVAAAYIMWRVFPPLLIFILPGLTAIIVTHFYQKSMGAEMKKRKLVQNLHSNQINTYQQLD
ncbi:YesL family protein [Niallia sp. 03133]|uniref:YesL family protein n=1 Tax=Niallia sp. 03133 TaxID=3458060 RepID=UPI004044B680